MNINNDFITTVLDNYSKFLSLENLEIAYHEVELRDVSNLKVILASIFCVIPYFGYGWLAINYFHPFITFLISISEFKSKSIITVLLLSSVFVLFNFIVFTSYKKLFSNLNDYTLSSLKFYLKDRFVSQKVKDIEKRKKMVIEDTILILMDSTCDCENEFKRRILYKLCLIAREPAIPDNCEFHKALINNLSERDLISINIFDYNDKIKTM